MPRRTPASAPAAALVALAALAPPPAAAQSRSVRALGGLLGVGGYFPSAPSGRNALGEAKFAGDTAIFGRPRRFGNLLLTGGLEIVNARDRFLPFSGGNGFTLVGPAFAVTVPRVLGRPRPYFSGGLFYGNLRSDRIGVDSSSVVPGAALGVQFPFARYFTLDAAYRVNGRVGGVNLDGFQVSLRVFSSSL